MQIPAVGKVLMTVGIIISGFADPHGLGRSPDSGWRQILGVIVGALIILAGFHLRQRMRRGGRRSPS